MVGCFMPDYLVREQNLTANSSLPPKWTIQTCISYLTRVALLISKTVAKEV